MGILDWLFGKKKTDQSAQNSSDDATSASPAGLSPDQQAAMPQTPQPAAGSGIGTPLPDDGVKKETEEIKLADMPKLPDGVVAPKTDDATAPDAEEAPSSSSAAPAEPETPASAPAPEADAEKTPENPIGL